ncbi:hypothetical protein [Gloeobacter kilaueensis]|uniref:Uncharacterized protein n=1 Tax=Gloeobacter kilaueensis (strain ATCC BAA-2537 / CCAP 1431/1 / ULC 316 / JS1) TaxID=1183438 RepID=U5QHL0_GLOK1|nr:hypothetical protein [Gloeobacter kilaueensis]AGY58348.1 hypothetical protein GKIL_2102 [Gloeobacter kilaueensis JS1]
MATAPPTPDPWALYLPGWPLATYRECAVHIAQLAIQAQVVLRSNPHFDSHLDQVECLTFDSPRTAADRRQLAVILEYYLQRYYETPDTRGDTARLVRGDQVYSVKAGARLLPVLDK